MKLRANDLQLGAETRSELRTTLSPLRAVRHMGSEGKCYAINLNPAPFTVRSFPVRNTTQPGSSPHNILHNFRGKKKPQTLHKGCQTNHLLHNETGSRICSKDNWDSQAALVYRMNLVPKGRFPHWYFRRMRKPLKITYPPPFLHRDATSTLSPAPHPPPDMRDPAT